MELAVLWSKLAGLDNFAILMLLADLVDLWQIFFSGHEVYKLLNFQLAVPNYAKILHITDV